MAAPMTTMHTETARGTDPVTLLSHHSSTPLSATTSGTAPRTRNAITLDDSRIAGNGTLLHDTNAP